MPIYEYKCNKGHVFDVMQRMSEDPLKSCQVCGGAAKRVLHAPAVHFKGSGFYNTDYGTRRRSREGREEEGKSTGSGDAAKSDTDAAKSTTESKKAEPAVASSSSSSSSSSSD
jgi:putative FmdB family regulatory protein